MRRRVSVGLGAAMCVILGASATLAQGTGGASIAGVVRDATRAVLPRVTVEAASPALIEKVKTTVTDEQGQYRIIELHPGTYTVTFTLPSRLAAVHRFHRRGEPSDDNMGLDIGFHEDHPRAEHVGVGQVVGSIGRGIRRF